MNLHPKKDSADRIGGSHGSLGFWSFLWFWVATFIDMLRSVPLRIIVLCFISLVGTYSDIAHFKSNSINFLKKVTNKHQPHS